MSNKSKFIRVSIWTAPVFFKLDATIHAPESTPKAMIIELMNQVHGTGNWNQSALTMSSRKVKVSKLDSAYFMLEERIAKLTTEDKIRYIHSEVVRGKYIVRLMFPIDFVPYNKILMKIQTNDFGLVEVEHEIVRTTSEGVVVVTPEIPFDLDLFYIDSKPTIRSSASIKLDAELYQLVKPTSEETPNVDHPL